MTDEELIDQFAYHNAAYWKHNNPELTDTEFGELEQELRRRHPSHPLLTSVQAPEVHSLGKVTHVTPLLSLAKAFTLEEVIDWADKVQRSEDEIFVIEPKYDGMTASYRDNILATRGDGYVGDNITDKLPLIEVETKTYTGRLKFPVLGELLIRKDIFETVFPGITKKDGTPYKNPRNAIAGIVGAKDIGEFLQHRVKLTLVAYDRIQFKVTLKQLRANWSDVVKDIEALPYPMDGIVIKLEDETYAKSLGSTAHHPRGAIAFKFEAIRYPTKLIGVEWGLGKRVLTPVAILEPIRLDSVTISRATLHNIKNIEDNDIQIGDTLTVERSGDVIPYVVDNEPGEQRTPIVLKKCPYCGKPVARIGPELYCVNKSCQELLLRQLLCGVQIMDIQGLGEKTIQEMMRRLKVSHLIDFFQLTKEEIMLLDGFQVKSATNLYQELRRIASGVADYRVLAAMNIQHMGINTAKLLCRHKTIEQLFECSEDDLMDIQGIGIEKAYALVRGLDEKKDELLALMRVVRIIPSQQEDEEHLLTVCFTGKMPHERHYYEKIARLNNWRPVDKVTRGLNYLVVSEQGHQSNKVRQAMKYNVFVTTVDEWLKLVKQR